MLSWHVIFSDDAPKFKLYGQKPIQMTVRIILKIRSQQSSTIVIESLNGLGLKGPLNVSSPIALPWQGHLSLDQVAQSTI